MNYVKIGDVCSIHARIGWQGLTKKEYLIAGDYYLVTGVDFLNGNVDFRHCYFVSKDRYEQDVHIQVEKDDVLVTKDGTIGKVAYIAEKPQKPATLNSGVFVVRPQSTKQLLPRYLKYALESNHFSRFIESIKVGCTIPHLNQEKFLNYRIALPSLVEQMNVIEQLDIVYSLLSKKKSQISMMDELVKSRFVEMFGDPETNPYGWRKTTVGDVCSSVVRGPFGSALKKEFFVEPNGSTYKVYEQKHAIQKSATIGTYYISAEKFGELRRFECRPGDILMSCSGTMGELFQLPSGCERGVINQALCKFTLSDCILPIVFLTYMRQTIGNLETKGSGIQNIAAISYVKAMPINLPPMEVQRRFAAFVSEVDKSKLAVKQSLEKLETLKKSLMQQYFG